MLDIDSVNGVFGEFRIPALKSATFSAFKTALRNPVPSCEQPRPISSAVLLESQSMSRTTIQQMPV